MTAGRPLLALIIVAAVDAGLFTLRRLSDIARRRRLLLLHGGFLALFAGPTWLIDIGIELFGWKVWPFTAWHGKPLVIMGFYEGLGLGFVLGVGMLLSSRHPAPTLPWTGMGAAAGLILGLGNTYYWEEAFVANDFTVQGLVATTAHWAFGLLQAAALVHALRTGAGGSASAA